MKQYKKSSGTLYALRNHFRVLRPIDWQGSGEGYLFETLRSSMGGKRSLIESMQILARAFEGNLYGDTRTGDYHLLEMRGLSRSLSNDR